MAKRNLCTAVLLAILLLFGTNRAYAAQGGAETDALYEQSMEDIADALPDSVAQYLEDDAVSADGGVVNAFLAIINDLFGDFGNIIKGPLKLFGILCAVLVLCAAAGFYTQDNAKISAESTVSVVGALAVSATASGAVITAVNAAMETVELSEQFVAGFIPVYAGLMVSSGHVTSAAFYTAGLLAVAAAASSVISLFIKPLTGVMLGVSLVSGIQENGMTPVVAGVKKTVMWTLGIVTSIFVGLMGLQGTVSTQSDNLTLRTTKYLVGNSIPVIGSSVSEAVATVSGSFKLIRATVGSAGIIAVCGIFLPELVKLLLCSVAMSFAAAVGEVVGVRNLSQSIRGVKSAVDIMTAMLSFYFIALTVCTAIMIGTGSS